MDTSACSDQDWQAFARGLMKSFENNKEVQWARAPEVKLPKSPSVSPKTEQELLLAIVESAGEPDEDFLFRSAELLCNSHRWTGGTVPELSEWREKEIVNHLEYFAFLHDPRGANVPRERRITMAHRYLLLVVQKQGAPDTETIRKLLRDRLSHIAVQTIS